MADEPACFHPKTFEASDGYALSYRDYPAEQPERAQIVAIHGIQSHAGWYEGSCRLRLLAVPVAAYRFSIDEAQGPIRNTAAIRRVINGSSTIWRSSSS